MATRSKFRHEDVSAVPRGWKVRTVKHPSGHLVRIAFPPGPRRTGAGRLVSLLHPDSESNPCAKNPLEELVKDSKGKQWWVSVSGSREKWMAEGYPVSGKKLKTVGRPIVARGITEAAANDALIEKMEGRNPKKKAVFSGAWKDKGVLSEQDKKDIERIQVRLDELAARRAAKGKNVVKPKYRAWIRLKSGVDRFGSGVFKTRREALFDAAKIIREVKDDPNVEWRNEIETYGSVYDWGNGNPSPQGKVEVKSKKAKGKNPRFDVDTYPKGTLGHALPQIVMRADGKFATRKAAEAEAKRIRKKIISEELRANPKRQAAKRRNRIAVAGDFVKIRLHRGGETERIWVKVTKAGPRGVEGSLDNEPIVATHLRMGDTVKFKQADIVEFYGQNPKSKIKNPKSAPRRKNLDEIQGAQKLYETFQGKAATGVIDIHEPDDVRDDFAMLGWLISLTVQPRTRDEQIELKFRNDKVRLASNADGTQLYCIGGSQNLNGCLKQFNVDETKDLVELGECEKVVYLARKAHTKFEPTEWEHTFGEEGGLPPFLHYNRLQQRIFFDGGTYKIEAPGIID